MDATISRKKDGAVKRAELVKALEFHKAQIRRIEEELQRQPGAVSTRRVTSNTRKWLEGMSTPRLRAQAQKIGLDPDQYDEIEDVILAILTQMGMVD